MSESRKNRLAWLAAFFVPFAVGLLLVVAAGRNANNLFGYLLWLDAPNEDLFNILRLNLFRGYFYSIIPLLLGVAGLGWMAYRRRQKR
ncbi:MAG TPA: hypothetical protein PKW95_15500 [bacterium]|nr:hypothetical protein [bacterium]